MEQQRSPCEAFTPSGKLVNAALRSATADQGACDYQHPFCYFPPLKCLVRTNLVCVGISPYIVFGYVAAAALLRWWSSSEAHVRYRGKEGGKGHKILYVATHVETFTSTEKGSLQLCVCVIFPLRRESFIKKEPGSCLDTKNVL